MARSCLTTRWSAPDLARRAHPARRRRSEARSGREAFARAIPRLRQFRSPLWSPHDPDASVENFSVIMVLPLLVDPPTTDSACACTLEREQVLERGKRSFGLAVADPTVRANPPDVNCIGLVRQRSDRRMKMRIFGRHSHTSKFGNMRSGGATESLL